jgi:hypothetical protein
VSKQTAAPVQQQQFEELCRDNAHITCGYGNIVVIYSAESPDASYCERSARAINAWAANYPRGLGMLVLISANEPAPNEAARRAIHTSYVQMQRAVCAAVHVVEGEGFIASAKRSVITVMNMNSSFTFPIKIASTVPDGAQKLIRMMPNIATGLDTDRIATTVSSIRMRLH